MNKLTTSSHPSLTLYHCTSNNYFLISGELVSFDKMAPLRPSQSLQPLLVPMLLSDRENKESRWDTAEHMLAQHRRSDAMLRGNQKEVELLRSKIQQSSGAAKAVFDVRSRSIPAEPVRMAPMPAPPIKTPPPIYKTPSVSYSDNCFMTPTVTESPIRLVGSVPSDPVFTQSRYVSPLYDY